MQNDKDEEDPNHSLCNFEPRNCFDFVLSCYFADELIELLLELLLFIEVFVVRFLVFLCLQRSLLA